MLAWLPVDNGTALETSYGQLLTGAGMIGVLEAIEGEIRFEIRKRVLGFRVPDAPHMDPEGLAMFEASLRNARTYLEYGAGGSTVMAARMGKTGFSVEGDRHYCRDVRRKLAGQPHKIELTYADIGPTKMWGHLRRTRQTPKSVAAWTHYVRRPFERHNGDFYDLVLVDGRFRVACALHAIAEAARRGASFRLLLDDYDDPKDRRPHYKVVEDYVPLVRMAGRMAVFDVTPDTLLKTPDEAVLNAAVLDSR
jgi:hypothetical protein